MAHKKSILIVEDEPFLIEMYKARFEQEGYKVFVALNGEPVISIVKRSRPNLILLDIVMPEKDGYEVLRELKGSREFNNIPVLIFSNLAQDYEIKKGLDLGADDYFIKSDYTPSQLVERVTKMIIGKKKRSKTSKKTKPIRKTKATTSKKKKGKK